MANKFTVEIWPEDDMIGHFDKKRAKVMGLDHLFTHCKAGGNGQARPTTILLFQHPKLGDVTVYEVKPHLKQTLILPEHLK